jgi:hypothetical protein
MIEPTQVTRSYVDSQDSVDNRVDTKEQAVDDGTDIEGEEVNAGEEVAEGQTATSQQIYENIQLPLKQREMKKCGGTLGSGGSGQRASIRRQKMKCTRRRNRPAPSDLKN